MSAFLRTDRGILVHALLAVASTHDILSRVLVVERFGMSGNVGMLQLLCERDLLELKLMQSTVAGADKGRARGHEEISLHVGILRQSSYWKMAV